MKVVCAIPARCGSKRLKDKNIKLLNGKPLLGYTVSVAIQSNLFSSVLLCTDSEVYAEVGKSFGATVPYIRCSENSQDNSPDIIWVNELAENLEKNNYSYMHN